MIKQLNAYFDNLQTRIEDALKSQYTTLCTSGPETVGELLQKTIEQLRSSEADI
jgi:hypothetical protein